MIHSFRGIYKKSLRHGISNTPDGQYFNMINRVLNDGELKPSRNGDVLSRFGERMEFSLNNNKVPILTTKKMAWKTCIQELLWFISGSTNNKALSDQGIKIWDGNASPEFKKKTGIFYEDIGDLGPIYGHQWRHFNAPYDGCNVDYVDKGIDQLQNVIDTLSHPEGRYSRRIVMSSWNPCQLPEMVLPPCHIIVQFNVNTKNELSCILYQRSADIALGVPFNIASYSILVNLLAVHCNLKPGKFVHFIGDAHIYKEHIPFLKKQTKLKPYESPSISITKREFINDYLLDDFKLNDYNSHPKIKMNMVA
jgi:thymidylate synthase